MSESLKDIRLFAAVYEERSFTAAAGREHATQSGVSQHIRKLEDRFNVRLFERNGSSVVPTPAADAYYRHCTEVLRARDAANQTLRRFGNQLVGEIVIGLMPTMTRCALAPALAKFLDAHPNVAVRIVEAYSAVLTEQVRAEELAFAVVPSFLGGAGLRHTLFARTPEVLVAAAGSRIDHLRPVRLAELGPLKIVVPGGQNTRRKMIETYLASNGVQVERLLELDAMLGTLDFIATTDWVTILPGVMMAREIEPGRFDIGPLAEPPLTLDLVLIESSHREMSPAAQAFADLLSEETARLNGSWPG
jgi:LysR family transcriptional regulator, nitrogen assimilation regulatory protein